MKKEVVFNQAKLVKITVFDKEIDDWYKYKKAIRLFGITWRKAGFYVKPWDNYVPEVNDPQCFVDGNTVYRKPRIHLYYQGEISQAIVFDTLKEAQDKANEIKQTSFALYKHVFN